MALITCTDVAFAYGGIAVVNGLSFTINPGNYLCILGENGSGKSTLLRGLLKLKAPSKGRIDTGDGFKAGGIGYMPQQTATQKDFPASVWEVALSGRLNSLGASPFYSKEDKRIAEANLARLGIGHLKKRCYRELSGGQQQRVLLARALCAARTLLLLDEPTAGLDPAAAQEFYTLIETINREVGIAIVMVSHDIQGAVRYASHILHLKNQQAFFGTVEEYRASDIGTGFGGGQSNV